MAQPLSAQSRSPDEPRPEEEGAIFRYVCGEDGELRILQLPATLENLLDPRLEDEVNQSEAHAVTLGSLFDVLRRYLKRLAPELAVFSDLLLLYRRHGHRDVTPDIAVVEGLGEARRDRKSLDVVGEGGRLVLVMEVVSESSGDARRKDEEENPRLFAELGVEDLVLVYPPESGRPLRVSARRHRGAGQPASGARGPGRDRGEDPRIAGPAGVRRSPSADPRRSRSRRSRPLDPAGVHGRDDRGSLGGRRVGRCGAAGREARRPGPRSVPEGPPAGSPSDTLTRS